MRCRLCSTSHLNNHVGLITKVAVSIIGDPKDAALILIVTFKPWISISSTVNALI